MPDLSFQVEGSEAVPFAASPTLAIKLRITNLEAKEAIHSVALNCQIMIDPARRRYQPEDQERLRDLFGEPGRWGQTVRPMLWTHSSTVVPSFTGSTLVDLPIQCTFDFNVGATKYFAGLRDGEVQLNLLFSGTIFYEVGGQSLQVVRIPWNKETHYRLPLKVWKDMMDLHYPNTAWLCLNRDVFDRLYQYKVSRGIPTWERVLEDLLAAESERGSDAQKWI